MLSIFISAAGESIGWTFASTSVGSALRFVADSSTGILTGLDAAN